MGSAMESSTDAGAVGPPNLLTEEQQEDRAKSLRQATIMTACLGLAHAILFLLSHWLASSAPGAQATDAEIANFYASDDRRRLNLAGLYIMPFAGVAFIWFIVCVRMWVGFHRPREDALYSNVQLVCGILYVGLFFAAGAAGSAVGASVEFVDAPVDPSVARQFPQFGNALLFVFAMRMAAMFVITASTILRRANAAPTWFVYSGFATGLFLFLSASFNRALILVFPIWLLLFCVLLFFRSRQVLPMQRTSMGQVL